MASPTGECQCSFSHIVYSDFYRVALDSRNPVSFLVPPLFLPLPSCSTAPSLDVRACNINGETRRIVGPRIGRL